MHGIKYRSRESRPLCPAVSLYTMSRHLKLTAAVPAVFQRLIPYAKQANIRLILVDRRGYGDSAPIDDVEIARATDPKSGADGFIKFHIARGFEVAQFLLTFIREEAIQGQKVTLLGWSAGNRNVAGFLAALPQLPASELAVLRASLAGIIMWGKWLATCFLPRTFTQSMLHRDTASRLRLAGASASLQPIA